MRTTWNPPLIIFLVLIFSGLTYLLSPILTPFLIGALLAYLVDPLVNKLMRFHFPRLLSVIIVFLILFSVIIFLFLLIIPLIEKQITTLILTLPNILDWLQNTAIPKLTRYFGAENLIVPGALRATLVENWTKAGTAATWIWKTALQSGLTIAEWIMNLVLIPVVTFYLLRDWDKLVKGLRSALPRNIEPTVVKIVMECDSVLSAFFRGQLLVMLSLAMIYSIGLSLIGLNVGMAIGLVAGLVSIVPYLGFILGISSASIAAYVQFGTTTSVLMVALVFLVGQSLESMVLTPKLVGHRIGLHPVAVIFSVLAGGSLFGFFGVLLALPVAAVIMVLLRFVYQRYQHSRLYR